MAVQLDVISVIIPIRNIEKHYPGGFEQYKKDYSSQIGGKIWFDDYILRDGAMNPIGIGLIIDEWERIGLKGIAKNKNGEYWKDLCVVDFFQGVTLPCKWLKTENYTAYHIDDENKHIVIGENDMENYSDYENDDF
jgi:hypothetical protein